MSTQTSIEDTAPVTPAAPSWPFAQRIAFRFCFAYFSLYVLSPATVWPIRLAILWVAKHIFGVTDELVYSGSGSGDKTFDWVLLFCLLVVAIAATAIWSALDRSRPSYPTLHKWFRLFLRLSLGSQMLGYGLAKAVPMQMPYPFFWQLLQPYGMKSPMGVLWSSVGASPAYEIFTGCAELTGGLLLIFPRTVTFGALICLADMVQVFMLNMTYDVPVKLLSFHLVILSLLLLAPDARRLINFLLLNRVAEPAPSTRLFASRRANRIAAAVVAVLWLLMIGGDAYGSWTGWFKYGGGRPRSPLYGIWNVDEMSIDGQPHPPLLTDNSRWGHIVFQFAEYMTFVPMDGGSHTTCNASFDLRAKTIALSKAGSKEWKANFAFDRPAPDRLTLDGAMDGHKVNMQLRLVDEKQFLLVSRGFHWIQEYPFNR